MRVEHHDQIDSTNDRAMAIIRSWRDEANGQPEPVLISADVQTAGRGRMGRVWQSPRGGAWFSIAWPWNDRPEKTQAIPLIVGWAVHQVLAEYVGDVAKQPEIAEELRLKWPNDLLWQDRKLAGVLCESEFHHATQNNTCNTHSTHINHAEHITRGLAIGVGINGNQIAGTDTNASSHSADSRSEPFAMPAVCLSEVTSSPCEVTPLIASCAKRIASALQAYHADGLTPIRIAQMNRILAWRGQSVTIRSHRRTDDSLVAGRLEALAADGRLLIQTDAGVIAMDHGELRRAQESS